MKHPWKRASFIVPESVMELDREEVIITNCFEKGYHYEKIIIFQSKFHGINISFRTLKKRIQSYGLSRKRMNVTDEELVRRRIQQKSDGPGIAQCGML